MITDFSHLDDKIKYDPQGARQELRHLYCHALSKAHDSQIDILYLIIKATYYLGEYKRVQTMLDMVIKRGQLPEHHFNKFLSLRATTCHVLGLHKEAAGLYQHLVMDAKKRGDSRVETIMLKNLAFMMIEMELYKEAQTAYENLMYLNPNHTDLSPDVTGCYGLVLYLNQADPRGVDLLRGVLEDQSVVLTDTWWGYLNEFMGMVLCRQGKHDLALSHYQKAFDYFTGANLQKAVGNIHYRKGLVYQYLHQHEVAQKEFALSLKAFKALGINALEGKVLVALSRCQEHIGSDQTALALLKNHVKKRQSVVEQLRLDQSKLLNQYVEHNYAAFGLVALEREHLALKHQHDRLSSEYTLLDMATQKHDYLVNFAEALSHAKNKEKIYHLCKDYLHFLIGHDHFFVGFVDDYKDFLSLDCLVKNGEMHSGKSYDLAKSSYSKYAVEKRTLVRVATNALDTPSDKRAMQSMMFAPMMGHQRVLGVVSVQHHFADYYTHYDEALFEVVTAMIAGALNNVAILAEITEQRSLQTQMLRTLKSKNKQLKNRTQIDALTGLFNRVGLEKSIDQWLLSTPGTSEFVVGIMDLDYFKVFNDTHGHVKGDQLLVKLSDLIKEVYAKDHYLLARFGGEEFIVIASSQYFMDLVNDSKKLKDRVQDLPPQIGVKDRVTISIGITCGEVTSTQDVMVLLDYADKQLYQAKAEGRNRICTA